MTTDEYRISNIEFSEKGSVIIYAMLTMTVMLAIGLTLTSLFISKLRAAAATRNAMVALYAADSATEMCLYEARSGVNDQPLVFDTGATITIATTDIGSPDISEDCSVIGSASFEFRATGNFRGSRRTLEISQ
jgi:hypothetical protein